MQTFPYEFVSAIAQLPSAIHFRDYYYYSLLLQLKVSWFVKQIIASHH